MDAPLKLMILALSCINYHYIFLKPLGRWKKGKPLPADLRDSGIESHCAFALNSSHVFLAGGYAKPYNFVDHITGLVTGGYNQDACNVVTSPLGEGIDLNSTAKVSIRG